MFRCVEGNIGAGKSTFLDYIKKYYAESGLISIHDEPIETWRNLNGHNILDKFYKFPARYGLLMQVCDWFPFMCGVIFTSRLIHLVFNSL